MKTQHISVVPYSSRWSGESGKICDVLASALGFWAQSILDIDIIIETYDRFSPAAECLVTLGYVHDGNRGREAFECRDPPQFMPHHLYVFRNHL